MDKMFRLELTCVLRGPENLAQGSCSMYNCNHSMSPLFLGPAAGRRDYANVTAADDELDSFSPAIGTQSSVARLPVQIGRLQVQQEVQFCVFELGPAQSGGRT